MWSCAGSGYHVIMCRKWVSCDHVQEVGNILCSGLISQMNLVQEAWTSSVPCTDPYSDLSPSSNFPTLFA